MYREIFYWLKQLYWTGIGNITIPKLSLWLYSIGHILIPILSLRLQRQILTDTSDCISWYWGFRIIKANLYIKGIFLCDEAIVSLINLHFEAMKRLFRYWNPLKRSVDTIRRSVSVSEARKVGTSSTFAKQLV